MKKLGPWAPVEWSNKDGVALPAAYAIQALERGEATKEQQQAALIFIVEVICGAYDLPYYPESSRDSDFACGKMFVGKQIVKLTKLNLGVLSRKGK